MNGNTIREFIKAGPTGISPHTDVKSLLVTQRTLKWCEPRKRSPRGISSRALGRVMRTRQRFVREESRQLKQRLLLCGPISESECGHQSRRLKAWLIVEIFLSIVALETFGLPATALPHHPGAVSGFQLNVWMGGDVALGQVRCDSNFCS